MNRESLIAELSNKTHFTRENSTLAVNAFMDILTETVKSHDSIVFHGLFTLQAVIKSARHCRNPQTNEPLYIPPKRGYKLLISPKVKEFLEKSDVQNADE